MEKTARFNLIKEFAQKSASSTNNNENNDHSDLLKSADDYSKLEEGKTYKVYGYWFRFPMLSWFPRIYKIE